MKLLPRSNVLSFLTYFFQILKKHVQIELPLFLFSSLPRHLIPDVLSSAVVCVFPIYMSVFLPHNVFYIYETHSISISVVTECALFNDQTASFCDRWFQQTNSGVDRRGEGWSYRRSWRWQRGGWWWGNRKFSGQYLKRKLCFGNF